MVWPVFKHLDSGEEPACTKISHNSSMRVIADSFCVSTIIAYSVINSWWQ